MATLLHCHAVNPLVITLDGPAGSGKSTVARLLAGRLGVAFLDTGAMYRGLAAYCLDKGIDVTADRDRVIDVVSSRPMAFDRTYDPPRLVMDGRDMTDRLRDLDTNVAVSDVAGIEQVRQVLVEAQRRIGRELGRMVTEGRDQGSVVFPDAVMKFFLDAEPQVRAERRSTQLRDEGKPVDEQLIQRQMARRDQRDKGRRAGPLTCPHDATRVDTTDMTLDQVVERLEKLVKQRVGENF